MHQSLLAVWAATMLQILIILALLSSLDADCGANDYSQDFASSYKKQIEDEVRNVIRGQIEGLNGIQKVIKNALEQVKGVSEMLQRLKASGRHSVPEEMPKNGTVSYIANMKTLIDKSSCAKNCQPFEEHFDSQVNAVVDILKDLKPVNGTSLGENSLDDVLYVLHSLRDSMSPDFFKYVFMRTVSQREETKGVPISIREFDPESPVPYREYKGQDFQAFEQGISPVAGLPEERVDHFREDPFLHYFHELWHANNGQRHPRNRAGERFWFAHHQILARYFIERVFNGMEPSSPLDINAMRSRFPSRYRGEKDGFRGSMDFCQISASNVNDLQNRRNSVLNNRAANLDESILRVEVVYHNNGHVYISQDCKLPGPESGFMGNPRVAARDPIFYRWHKEIDNTIYQFQEFRGSYTQQELAPAAGIVVDDFSLLSQCGNTNRIQTFQDRLASTREGRQFEIYNHETYTWRIRVRNNNGNRKKVIIRIYMVPANRRTDTSLYALMDQWTHTLNGQTTETIDRTDGDSSIIDTHNRGDCGLPRHLLIPHGGSQGSPNVARAVVFIHDVNANVNEGENGNRPVPLCGSEDTSTVVDNRFLGFPIHKSWPGNTFLTAVDNRNGNYGNIGTNIQIVHLRARDCSVGQTPTTPRPTGPPPTPPQPTTPSTTTSTTTSRPSPTPQPPVQCTERNNIRVGQTCYRVGPRGLDHSTANRFCDMNGRMVNTNDDRWEINIVEHQLRARDRLRFGPYFWAASDNRAGCTLFTSAARFGLSCTRRHPNIYTLCIVHG